MDKTVLITGCSSGIGKATAARFLAAGWRVAATARRVEALDGFAAANGLPLRLDVTDDATIGAAVAATLARFGTIDVLVNNAGYGLLGPLEGASTAQLEAQFRTNVVGAAAVIRHVLPAMRRQRSGTIVNMSSVGGRIATPMCSAYYASKFALEGLSESLRFELKLHGIRVKVIEPAHFKSDFLGRSLQWADHPAYAPQLARMRDGVRKMDSRMVHPADEVAAAVLRAATDRSGRLRYPVGGRVLRAMHALMPDPLWRTLVGATMRAPRETSAT